MIPRQGDVWDIRFRAEDGDRPGIIATRNELNKGRIVLVVPCTKSHKTSAHANIVPIEATAENGLSVESFAQVHLIQPVDREWFNRQRGRLSDEDLSQVLQALVWAVDFYE